MRASGSAIKPKALGSMPSHVGPTTKGIGPMTSNLGEESKSGLMGRNFKGNTRMDGKMAVGDLIGRTGTATKVCLPIMKLRAREYTLGKMDASTREDGSTAK